MRFILLSNCALAPKLNEHQSQLAAVHFQCMLVTKGVCCLGYSEQRDCGNLSNHKRRFEVELCSDGRLAAAMPKKQAEAD